MSQDNVWIDGCFDFFHHGHANAILQSKQHGSYLVAGVHSDEDIELNKGPTVMKLNERFVAIQSNKWVDKVVANAPYVTDPVWMDRENCWWVVHGDDITTDANGNDCYDAVRKAGRLRLVKRTEGVSTTDLISIIMTSSKKHYLEVSDVWKDEELIKNFATDRDGKTAYNNVWVNEEGDKLKILQQVDLGDLDFKSDLLLYGTFDLFNPFHITALKEAKDQYKGRNIIIGILKDGYFEQNTNIMNLTQRSLCVLQCKFVVNTIIGVQQQLIDKFENKIDIETLDNEFSYLKSGGIKNRILGNFEVYQKRQARKGIKMELETELKKLS